MAGKIGTAQVINYVNTTSGEAQGVRALFGVGGVGVVNNFGGGGGGGSFLLTENLEYLVQENFGKIKL
jgi:hypothetical protein